MPADLDVHRLTDDKRRSRLRGRLVAELAASQHGVVARWQLRGMGFTDDLIDGWIARSRLLVVFRGVYAVGRRQLTAAGRCMAGVLAGGVAAALSGRSAAWMWDLRDSLGGAVRVTVPRDRRSRPGLVFHRFVLPKDERTVHDSVPVTTVARTLFDAAATESPVRLRQMIALAEVRGLADSPSLPELLERYPGARGTARLRAAIASALSEGVAHRELELRFAEFVDAYGLPPPQRNAAVEVDGRTLIVDCLWPEARLVVELDSRRHHADWEAAEKDRARDAALLAVGLPTLRVTWRRLHHERPQLARQIWAAIERDRRLPSVRR